MPATADLAISRMDLSALLIRKLVSRTVVIVPITPPVVTILITRFQLRNRLLQLALSFLLWSDKQHVKDGDDEQHRQQAAERSQTALKEHENVCHLTLFRTRIQGRTSLVTSIRSTGQCSAIAQASSFSTRAQALYEFSSKFREIARPDRLPDTSHSVKEEG